ncbi:MAG: DUF4292 domain-containing protein [Crocinitomicaceae bacterium]|nr:DUF4292 domain-containing protein [Crocinitomicaceae bacterium]
MPSRILKIAVAVGCLVPLLQACGNRQHENDLGKIKKMSDKDLTDSLFKLQKKPFDFFYTKVGVDIEGTSQNVSFKASVKMRVDSAFSGTVTYAGFVGATYLVDQDSAKFTDKTKKCYRAESLSYLTGIFGTEIDYNFFQSLILGEPLGIDPAIKYKQIQDDQFYILSSHKKREIKTFQDDPDKATADDIVIQYYIHPNDFTLKKVWVNVPADTVQITIDYKERKYYDGFDYDFPENTDIKIVTPRDSSVIELNYSPIKLNEPKKIKINIPDSYVECTPDEE